MSDGGSTIREGRASPKATADVASRPPITPDRSTITASQHHRHHRMIAELAVEAVELLARGRADGEREREIGRLAAGAHLERGGVQLWGVTLHHVDHRLREPGLPPPEHLDRELAREGEQRRGSLIRHERAA